MASSQSSKHVSQSQGQLSLTSTTNKTNATSSTSTSSQPTKTSSKSTGDGIGSNNRNSMDIVPRAGRSSNSTRRIPPHHLQNMMLAQHRAQVQAHLQAASSANLLSPQQTNNTWYDETDTGYTIEIAKRSVARAALHLGIDSMSGDTLDLFGDALICFIERIGQSIAAIPERGNRSSAHCNILDALEAIETNMISLPQSEQQNSNRLLSPLTNNPINTPLLSQSGCSWERLAEFSFGSQWKDKIVVDFKTGKVMSRREILDLKKKQLYHQQRSNSTTNNIMQTAGGGNHNTNRMNQHAPAIANGVAAQSAQPPPLRVVPLGQHEKNGDKIKSLANQLHKNNQQQQNNIASASTSHPSNVLSNNKTSNHSFDKKKSVSSTDGKTNPNNSSSSSSDNHNSIKDPFEGAWSAPFLDVVPLYPLSTSNSTSHFRTNSEKDNHNKVHISEACYGDYGGIPGNFFAPSSSSISNENLDNNSKGEILKNSKKKSRLNEGDSNNSVSSSSNSNSKAISNTDTTKMNKGSNGIQNNNNNDDMANQSHQANNLNSNSSSNKNHKNLAATLDPNSDQYRPSYVPPHFPPFPSLHTYQHLFPEFSSSSTLSHHNESASSNNKDKIKISTQLNHLFEGSHEVQKSLVKQNAATISSNFSSSANNGKKRKKSEISKDALMAHNLAVPMNHTIMNNTSSMNKAGSSTNNKDKNGSSSSSKGNNSGASNTLSGGKNGGVSSSNADVNSNSNNAGSSSAPSPAVLLNATSTSSTSTMKENVPVIAPLEKTSVARACRIIEGSMDASHL